MPRAGVEHVAQDLGGHHDDRRLAVDRGVTGEQPDRVGAVPRDQLGVLLVRQRLDRRRVERLASPGPARGGSRTRPRPSCPPRSAPPPGRRGRPPAPARRGPGTGRARSRAPARNVVSSVWAAAARSRAAANRSAGEGMPEGYVSADASTTGRAARPGRPRRSSAAARTARRRRTRRSPACPAAPTGPVDRDGRMVLVRARVDLGEDLEELRAC